jgi:hypothetical protein
LARTQFGPFFSIALGVFTMLAGAVMMIAAVVALFQQLGTPEGHS